MVASFSVLEDFRRRKEPGNAKGYRNTPAFCPARLRVRQPQNRDNPDGGCIPRASWDGVRDPLGSGPPNPAGPCETCPISQGRVEAKQRTKTAKTPAGADPIAGNLRSAVRPDGVLRSEEIIRRFRRFTPIRGGCVSSRGTLTPGRGRSLYPPLRKKNSPRNTGGAEGTKGSITGTVVPWRRGVSSMRRRSTQRGATTQRRGSAVTASPVIRRRVRAPRSGRMHPLTTGPGGEFSSEGTAGLPEVGDCAGEPRPRGGLDA